MIDWFLHLEQLGQVVIALAAIVCSAIVICKFLDLFKRDYPCSSRYDW